MNYSISRVHDPEINAWIKELIWQHCGAVKPEENSDDINFRCPFCGDSKKNKRKKRGHYYKKTGSFYCFNGECSRAATWQQLAAKLTGMTEEQVEVEMIGRRLSTSGTQASGDTYLQEMEKEEQLKKGFVDRAMRISGEPLTCKLPADCVPWRESPIALEQIEKRMADLGEFAPPEMAYFYSPSLARIIIPWYDIDGNMIYWQGRATLAFQEPKYLFPEDTWMPIFPMMHDPDWKYLVIVEGVFDGIWVKNGLVCGSCKCTHLQQRMLKIWRQMGYKMIWMLDNDATDAAAKKSIRKMLENPQYVNDLFFRWPSDLKKFKDVNETILALGENPFGDKDFILGNSINIAEMIVEMI